MPPKWEHQSDSTKIRFLDLNKGGNTSSLQIRPRMPSGSASTKFDANKALGTARKVFDTLKTVSGASDLLGPLNNVCETLKWAVERATVVIDNDDKRTSLITKLSEQQQFIDDNTSPLTDSKFELPRSLTQRLITALEDYASKLDALIETLEGLIPSRKDKGRVIGLLARTFAPDSDWDELNTCSDQLERSFCQFMDSVIFFIADRERFMAQQSAEISARQALNRLRYVDGAQGNQHSSCLEGTRKDILHEIAQWAIDDAKPVFCLVDQAGTGKSTISTQIARQWNADHSLISRFFFSKPMGITSAENFASTIAIDMAVYIPFLRALVIKVLDDHPKMSSYSIEKKLELLVIIPLKKLKEERGRALELVRQEMREKAQMEAGEWKEFSGDILHKASVEDARMVYLEALKAVEKGRRNKPLLEALERTYTAYLEALEQSLIVRPIIVIDALDECGAGDRIKILRSLLDACVTGSAPFKLFLACRPEKDIITTITEDTYAKIIGWTPSSLHSADISSKDDIHYGELRIFPGWKTGWN